MLVLVSNVQCMQCSDIQMILDILNCVARFEAYTLILNLFYSANIFLIVIRIFTRYRL